MSLSEASLRPHPQPHRGTLTPLVPLSLRAFKGEGEIRTEARTGAVHPCGPLVQYWGEGDGFPTGVGNDGWGWGEKNGAMAKNEVVYGQAR